TPRPPRLSIHQDLGSDLERAAAAAALDDVRVVEDEPALLQAVVEVDDRAVEVRVELLVDRELDAVEVDDAVAVAGRRVEVQAVGEAAAAAPLDADAEDCALRRPLLLEDALDLAGRLLGKNDTHRFFSLQEDFRPALARRENS